MTHEPRFYWHLHHDVLVEVTTNIRERMDYIMTYKSFKEMSTRMQRMQLVRGELPDACVKAGEAYDKAREATVKAWEAAVKAGGAWKVYDSPWEATAKAWKAYTEAREAETKARGDYKAIQNMPEIGALHRIECPDCPWDGTTIFPGTP